MLFQLDANTFRSVVTSSRADSKVLIKTLRSISLLQALSVGQLEQLAQIMVPVSHPLLNPLSELLSLPLLNSVSARKLLPTWGPTLEDSLAHML